MDGVPGVVIQDVGGGKIAVVQNGVGADPLQGDGVVVVVIGVLQI